MNNRIKQTFDHLKAKGEKALIPYIMAGDPSLAMTESLVLALAEGGADLIELGVSVINCQSNCMDNDEVGRRFKGQICFRTDIDRQMVMTFGTPADVKKHIGELFHSLGSEKGGIIACGEIGRDTTLDNIEAMYEAFHDFCF